MAQASRGGNRRSPDADCVILADPEGNRFCDVDANLCGGYDPAIPLALGDHHGNVVIA
jgi:hypothetical protein